MIQDPATATFIGGLAHRATLKIEAKKIADRHDLDFLVLDGWIYRRHRSPHGGYLQDMDGGLTRYREATEIERALWNSLR